MRSLHIYASMTYMYKQQGGYRLEKSNHHVAVTFTLPSTELLCPFPLRASHLC